MSQISFSDTEMDESPPTIAYALLTLLSAAFNLEFVILDDYDEEVIVVRDEDSGVEYVRLAVSPMMGMLLISVLNRTGEEIGKSLTEGDQPWILSN